MFSHVYTLLLLLPLASSQATCFYPDGTIATNDSPCRTDGALSACCGKGYACLSNGLCKSTGSEVQKGDATDFVRGSCTDKTWQSDGCPKFCISPELDNLNGGAGVGLCPRTDNIFYCINDGAFDCSARLGVLPISEHPVVYKTIGQPAPTTKSTIIPVASTSVIDALSSSSAISKSTASAAPATEPKHTESAFAGSNESDQEPPHDMKHSTNTVLIIGVGVGGLALGTLIGLGILWYRKKRWNHKPRSNSISMSSDMASIKDVDGVSGLNKTATKIQSVYELPGNNRQSRPYELAG